jgi:hypothetical protein
MNAFAIALLILHASGALARPARVMPEIGQPAPLYSVSLTRGARAKGVKAMGRMGGNGNVRVTRGEFASSGAPAPAASNISWHGELGMGLNH